MTLGEGCIRLAGMAMYCLIMGLPHNHGDERPSIIKSIRETSQIGLGLWLRGLLAYGFCCIHKK